MKKAYRWITVLLCAAAMVFSFTSCTNGDDDDNDSINTSATATTSSTTNTSDSDSSSGSGSSGTATSGSTTIDNSSSSSGSGSSGTSTSGSTTTDNSGSSSGSGSAETISAYLPDEFASKEVSALYTCSESYEEDGTTVHFLAAYYFFSDGNWVVTNSGTETANGQTESFQESCAKGTYTHTGDFVNDVITRNTTHEWYNTDWIETTRTKTISVTNGSFTKQDGEETLTFTKQ